MLKIWTGNEMDFIVKDNEIKIEIEPAPQYKSNTLSVFLNSLLTFKIVCNRRMPAIIFSIRARLPLGWFSG